MRSVLISILLVFITFFTSIAQTDKLKAEILANDAVAMMDSGRADEAIIKLAQAEKLDPVNAHSYEYEIAYAYYIKKDYKKASGILAQIVKATDVQSNYFQMLGNIYDMMGDSSAAIKTYKDGLTKFPEAGNLYLEQGNVYFAKENYLTALDYYENGINAAPSYSSNYYRAALIYLASTEKVWGMQYGEILMLLEPSSERSGEMSEKLYKTYGKAIEWKGDTSVSVSFTKVNTISVEDVKKKKIRMPYASFAYEMPMMMCALSLRTLDYEKVCKMRQQYLNMYYEKEMYKDYPNALYDYIQRLSNAGHAEAYHHWAMREGNYTQFRSWIENNQTKWDSFTNWFSKNRFALSKTDKYSRQQIQ